MHSRYTLTNHSFHNYRTVNYYNPPPQGWILGEVIFFTKSEIFFSRDSRGRLYFLQNLKIFFRASRGRLYFLQNPQFFLALRAGMLYFLQNQPPKSIVF